jgi:hypothetical protein
MSRRDKGRSARIERVRALLEGGDHGAARAAARALLAEADATDAERAGATAALDGLAPDRGALAAGLVGVIAAVAVAVWTVVRG